MGRYRTICRHPRVADINAASLIGSTLAAVGGEYGFSASALYRHKAAHLPVAVVASEDAREAVQTKWRSA